MRQLKIGTSWVRGVIGDALTPELIANFACAFGTWCDGGPVVVGRDTRRSAPMARAAVVSGLLSTGSEVIDIGVCTTPLCSFAVRELGAAGGISITGSHNDGRWNALKFIGPDGTLLNAVKSEELLDIFHAAGYRRVGWSEIGKVTDEAGISERYLENILGALDQDAIREAGIRVVLDCCNGAVGHLARRFLDALGCTLLAVNGEPTGMFAHPPAPNVANMSQLAEAMRGHEARLGAAINVDGDRIGFVTADGRALSEEYALPLAAQHRLARRPGPVVTNLSTSRMIDYVAREHEVTVFRTLVGEGHVVDRGIAEGAALAGEGCGGVAVLPVSMTFDALLTLGMVLESMAIHRAELAEMGDRIPRLEMRKGELACSTDLVYHGIEACRRKYGGMDPDCTDGVRVEWPDAWLHVRASMTEPLLRVIVEADTAERADAIHSEATAFVRRVVSADERA